MDRRWGFVFWGRFRHQRPHQLAHSLCLSLGVMYNVVEEDIHGGVRALNTFGCCAGAVWRLSWRMGSRFSRQHPSAYVLGADNQPAASPCWAHAAAGTALSFPALHSTAYHLRPSNCLHTAR